MRDLHKMHVATQTWAKCYGVMVATCFVNIGVVVFILCCSSYIDSRVCGDLVERTDVVFFLFWCVLSKRTQFMFSHQISGGNRV